MFKKWTCYSNLVAIIQAVRVIINMITATFFLCRFTCIFYDKRWFWGIFFIFIRNEWKLAINIDNLKPFFLLRSPRLDFRALCLFSICHLSFCFSSITSILLNQIIWNLYTKLGTVRGSLKFAFGLLTLSSFWSYVTWFSFKKKTKFLTTIHRSSSN